MKIVIDIPKDDFIKAKKDSENHLLDRMWDAVAHGTPLPKGHGRLISAERLIEQINLAEENFKAYHIEELEDGDSFCDGILSAVFNIRAMVQNASTIIEGSDS